MAITTKTFTDLVRDFATAVQARSAGLVDFSVGSILRAVDEAVATTVLWLQAQILALLARTRASTAVGIDLDTWVADYGLARLPAVAATGEVVFGRFTGPAQRVIAVGSTVQTADGSQGFAVYADTANSAYDEDLGGYVMGAGVLTLNVPVRATTPGGGGNAVAGAITVISSAIPGVDTVINNDTFANGADAETDAALRIRFRSFLASLSKATKAAIEYAIAQLQVGLSYTIDENLTYAGTVQKGHFSVVIDDGTGSPSAELLAQVYAAVDAVRALTVSFEVHGPTPVMVTVAVTVTILPGFNVAAVKAAVKLAIETYINTLGMGVDLRYTRIAQVAYDASPGVENVSGMTLNGGTADIVAASKESLKHGTVTVS